MCHPLLAEIYLMVLLVGTVVGAPVWWRQYHELLAIERWSQETIKMYSGKS